jgi:iron complex outermembrane receptor protein
MKRAYLKSFAASPMALALALAAGHAAAAQGDNSQVAQVDPGTQVAQAGTTAAQVAQTGGQANNGGLEEIVVTARKTAEDIQRVPVSVTALSAYALTQNNARNLADISGTVPGLQMATGSNSPIDYLDITIRGQSQQNALATVDPAVSVYVDGMVWSRAYGLNTNLLDVKDIQVLRGPQGTLFGRNTTGGAVLIETNDPDLQNYSGEVDASYGNYNYWQGEGYVNIPVVQDQLAVRAAFSRTGQDGYEPLVGDPSQKDGSQNNLNARLKLLWQPTNDLTVSLSAAYYFADFNMPAFNLAYLPTNSYGQLEIGIENLGAAGCFANVAGCYSYGESVAQSDIQKYAHSYTAASLIPNSQKEKTQTYEATIVDQTALGQFKLIAGYRRVDDDSINNYGGAPYVFAYFNAFQHLYQWSTEATLSGKALDDRLTYTTGLFYFNESGLDGSLFLPFADVFGGIIPQYLGHIGNRSVGIYGQMSYALTDKLHLTEGLRWSQDMKSVTVYNGTWTGGSIYEAGGLFIDNTPGGIGSSIKTTNGNVSYLLDLDYELTPDQMLYAKTEQGYRGGGANLREVLTGTATTYPNTFKPEQSTEYELGYKSEWWDHRLRFNIDGYFTIVRNMQRTFIVPPVPPSTTAVTFEGNAQQADFAGGEMELDAKVWEENNQDLTLTFNASNTNPWWVSYSNPFTGFDQSHEKFDNIAKYLFSLGGTYNHEFGFGVFSFHANYNWDSGYALQLNSWYYNGAGVPTDASGNGPYPTVADAAGPVAAMHKPADGYLNLYSSLTFDDDRYEVAVWGKNVTGTHPQVASSTIGGFFTSIALRPPAMFGLTGTVHF